MSSLRLTLRQTDGALNLAAQPEALRFDFVAVVKGARGINGDEASVSTDPHNRLTKGSDDRLFVPELEVDPLAYYILAKA